MGSKQRGEQVVEGNTGIEKFFQRNDKVAHRRWKYHTSFESTVV